MKYITKLWPKNVAILQYVICNYPPFASLIELYLYKSYHDSCQQANPFPTVGMRDHVAIADGQEGDGDQPHCSKEGTGHLLCIMIPVETWLLAVAAADGNAKHWEKLCQSYQVSYFMSRVLLIIIWITWETHKTLMLKQCNWFLKGKKMWEVSWYLSHTRTVHAAMIQHDTLKTSRTVPGQMVIRVFMTKRVSKLILLSAPMLREEASVNSLLWSSMTRPIR